MKFVNEETKYLYQNESRFQHEKYIYQITKFNKEYLTYN